MREGVAGIIALEGKRKKKLQKKKTGSPASSPVWAGWQAGLLTEGSGRPPGLGWLRGRPRARGERPAARPRPSPRPGNRARPQWLWRRRSRRGARRGARARAREGGGEGPARPGTHHERVREVGDGGGGATATESSSECGGAASVVGDEIGRRRRFTASRLDSLGGGRAGDAEEVPVLLDWLRVPSNGGDAAAGSSYASAMERAVEGEEVGGRWVREQRGLGVVFFCRWRQRGEGSAQRRAGGAARAHRLGRYRRRKKAKLQGAPWQKIFHHRLVPGCFF